MGRFGEVVRDVALRGLDSTAVESEREARIGLRDGETLYTRDSLAVPVLIPHFPPESRRHRIRPKGTNAVLAPRFPLPFLL
jgi:hypothetical protein